MRGLTGLLSNEAEEKNVNSPLTLARGHTDCRSHHDGTEDMWYQARPAMVLQASRPQFPVAPQTRPETHRCGTKPG